MNPERDGVPESDRLPPRDPPVGAEAARARLLGRIVPGGVVRADADHTEDRIGRYRLLRRLGSGGMGDVWEARGDGDADPVAVKVLRAAVAAHEPTRRRFLREARTAASVRHPRIVRILDVGSTDAGTPYIVMERLEGQPLEAIVRECGALSWPCAREILLQIADALAFAHARGVIHRDLKPANVMVRGGIEAPECTIIDFGLARREVIASGSESLSRTGEVFGSPPFMSPEQFRGDPADARSDVYSFGCLMFWVLTGTRPFQGDKIGELMYQHLFSPAPAPTGLRCPARLVPALESIMLRALRKTPALRFAGMDALADALGSAGGDPRRVEVPAEDAIAAASPEPARSPRPVLPWILAGTVALVGVAAVVVSRRDGVAAEPQGTPPTRSALPADPAPAEIRGPTKPRLSAPAPDPAPERAPQTALPRPVREPTATERTSAGSGERTRERRARRSSPPSTRADREPAPEPAAAASGVPPTTAVSELPPNPFRSPPADDEARTP